MSRIKCHDLREYRRIYNKQRYTNFSMRVPPLYEDVLAEIHLYCKMRGISMTSFFLDSARDKIAADPTWKDDLRNLLIKMQNAETQNTTE